MRAWILSDLHCDHGTVPPDADIALIAGDEWLLDSGDLDMVRALIVSNELGIYLGSFWGLGFWSKLDAVGQDEAVTFDNEADARDYMSEWETPVEDARIVTLVTDSPYVPLTEVEHLA